MKGRLKVLPIVCGLLILAGMAVIAFMERLPSMERGHVMNLKTQLDFIVPKLMEKHAVPGVAVGFVYKGTVAWTQGYGWADWEKRIPVTGGTVFQVASNSKTVAAWGVMKLVEKGLLDLDIPVGTYLTRWHLPKGKGKRDPNEVTIRKILNHTAGLSPGAYPGYPPGKPLPSLEDSLSGKVKGIKELRVIDEPGLKHRYTGGGYTLLQLAIEEVTQKSFARYMEEEVLIPLGMTHSSYEWNPQAEQEMATGYGYLGEPLPGYIYTEQAAAGLYTTAADLSRFVAANMDASNGESAGRNLLSETTLELMHTPGDEDYGLGYFIKKLPNGQRLIYHGGTNRGWRAQFALLPEAGDGLVVLTNSEHGKELHRDLVSLWTWWETGFYADYHRGVLLARIMTKTLAWTLLVLLGIYIWQMVAGIIRGETVWALGQKKKLSLGKVWIRSLLPLIFTALWIFVFFTGAVYNGWTLASHMPSGFSWITVIIGVWGIILGFGGFWIRIKDK